MFRSHIFRSLVSVAILSACTMLHAERLKRVFLSYDASNGLADNSAQTIKCTKTGRMVITTIGHVNFYDGSNFGHIDPKEENDYPLPKYSGHYHIYFDKHHNLWVKDKRKVTCVDLLKERFYTNVDSVIKSIGMKDKVDDLFGDSENVMWFLTGNKVYSPKWKAALPVVQKAELHDIDICDKSTLLQFFANGVVAAYDISTGRHLYDVPSADDGEEAHFESSVTLRDKRCFYQIRNFEKDGCLMRYDAESRQWKELMSVPYHLNNMVMFDGILFVACEYGYWEYNPVSGEKTHHEVLQLTNGRKLSTDVNTICFDRQGGMWIGTEKRGLLYAKPFSMPFYILGWDDPEAQKYSQMMDRLPDIVNAEPLGRHVNCKFTDSRGWTWTGLYTGVLLERPGQKPYLFTVKDGMMNEMVHCVIEDNYHDIWVGTSYGVCHFYVNDNGVKRLENYLNHDNLPRESFVNRRAMKLNDGTIVMQTLDHVVTFNPLFFHNDTLARMKLYPKLIRLMVNGRDITPGMKMDGRVILENAITRTWELNVGYDQNSLSLTFSGLNFLRPTQTYYRFRVKGLIDNWQILSYYNSGGQVDSRGLLHLPLMGLKPGSYDIEMQASLSPEVWPQDPIVWTIHVEEPWWRTTGLYALLFFVIITLLVLNTYYYNKNEMLRLDILRDQNDLVHRITSYANQSRSLEEEVVTPFSFSNDGVALSADRSFSDIMLKVVPLVQQYNDRGERWTVQQIVDETGIPLSEFYEQMSIHLNESPRQMMITLRLAKAAKMLVETDKTKEEIAEELNFVSPNYMIASFYHHYRQTPDDYRNSMAR